VSSLAHEVAIGESSDTKWASAALTYSGNRIAFNEEIRMAATVSGLMMTALVYLGDGKKAYDSRPKPSIAAPTDAIVKIVKTTICGTDLHILKGDMPEVTVGRILGHEGVGIIDEVGAGVTAFKRGDRVLISCVTSCGYCVNCRKLMFSHCLNGGWILGYQIDGTQAE
jgi:alcohol dehydrogenase